MYSAPFLRKLDIQQLLAYVNRSSISDHDTFRYDVYIKRLSVIKEAGLHTSDFIDAALCDHPRAAIRVYVNELTAKHVDYIVNNNYHWVRFVCERLTSDHIELLFAQDSHYVHKYLSSHPHYEALSKRDNEK